MLVFLLPLYIVQLCLFVLSIFYTNMAENAELSEDDDAIAEYFKKSRISVVFNQIMTVIMLVIMACVYRYTGKKYIYRVFTWFDITFYTLNTIANFQILTKTHDDAIATQRILHAFACLFFLGSAFYYMKLVDDIAPLIDIIIRIFGDIKWFMFVYICVLCAFSFAFYLLGANQIQFDEIPEDLMSKVKS